MTASEAPVQVWSDDEHQLIGVLADLVIPRGDSMPSATAVDVHTSGVEGVVRLRPDLIEPVTALLRRASERRPADLQELIGIDAGQFNAFAELVAGAYYLDPRVEAQTGYRGRTAIPVGNVDLQEIQLQGLVAPVVDRGNSWRVTPGS
jgi:hypothetical protein